MTNLIVFLSFLVSTNWEKSFELDLNPTDEKISRIEPTNTMQKSSLTKVSLGSISNQVYLNAVWKGETNIFLLESVKIGETISHQNEPKNSYRLFSSTNRIIVK